MWRLRLDRASPSFPLCFTDASWESGHGGLGAVMIDMATGEAMVYCGELPSALKDSWVDQLGEHIICQLELYVMVAIRWCLAERLSGGGRHGG